MNNKNIKSDKAVLSEISKKSADTVCTIKQETDKNEKNADYVCRNNIFSLWEEIESRIDTDTKIV